MRCKNCKEEMIISDWDGWIWMCPACDATGRKATIREIQIHEKEMGGFEGRPANKQGKLNTSDISE